MSSVELYSYDACPFAQRTRIVLAEKGVDYDLHEVDLQNKPDNWNEISPYGKVPVLRHAGGTVYESAIINEYLDEVFPEPPLMPDTALERAYARIWIDYCNSRFLPATHKLLWNTDKSADARRKNLEELYSVLRFMQNEGLARCGNGPYWFGTRPTLVDFHYLPFLERFGVYEKLAGFQWPGDCGRLRDWHAAIRARDSVRPTLKPLEVHIEQHHRLAERLANLRAAS